MKDRVRQIILSLSFNSILSESVERVYNDTVASLQQT